MTNVKLSTKIIAGFLFVAAISGIVGAVGISRPDRLPLFIFTR